MSIPTAEVADVADKPAEQSKYLTELWRLAWVSLLAVGGSAVSLQLGGRRHCVLAWQGQGSSLHCSWRC